MACVHVPEMTACPFSYAWCLKVNWYGLPPKDRSSFRAHYHLIAGLYAAFGTILSFSIGNLASGGVLVPAK